MEKSVSGEVERAVVDRPHDAFGVAAVGRTAVDGQRQVVGVTPPAVDHVGPAGVDGSVLVEGVGVVAAPLPVGSDDVHEPGRAGSAHTWASRPTARMGKIHL